ncbi:MAG: GTP cyclohydrolase I FolE [Pelagibacteraceae bacterium]|jgi:GTP cyclohydrolase I
MKNVTDIKHKILEKISKEEAEKAIKTILKFVGEDPNREGLLETPKRVVKAFQEYFSGYLVNPDEYLEKTFGDVEGYDDMVIQKNISIYSHCEHHMAPIIGMAHVAYVPSEKVVGLSKLARVVEAYSRRLQTQERLTMQIANSIYKGLKSHGSAVSIEAEHQCMTTRGVRKDKAMTVTNYFTGVFRDSLNLQQRFLTYIKD